jgi:CDP-diacylglycerol pyrophosphatase
MPQIGPRNWLLTTLLFLTGLLVAGSASGRELGAPPAPDTLWKQVGICIQSAITTNNFLPDPNLTMLKNPPCVYVARPMVMTTPAPIAELGDGYTILKDTDKTKPYGFLTVPSKVITGIEDPQVNFFSKMLVTSSYSPNYWFAAWNSLSLSVYKLYQLNQKKVLTPNQMGLAINSAYVRTLNQLHIHMSCLNKTAGDTLAGLKITTAWSAVHLPNAMSPYIYNVKLLPNLTSYNPFLEMYSSPGYLKDPDPAKQTLVVTYTKPGITPAGFILLEDYSHTITSGSTKIDDKGEGEKLLDQKCTTQ